jgi:hypothetical protein
MMDVTRGAAGEMVIRVRGSFDRLAARRLSTCVSDLPAAAPLVIDFSLVNEIEDLTVTAVARELARRGAVQLRGLGRHQLRLLRYCGLDLGARSDRGDGDAKA